MHKYLRYLHVIGMCMFLGSIAIHIMAGMMPGGRDSSPVILMGRQLIEISTWALTVPGLGILMVTGIIMVWKTRSSISQRKWLVAHLILAALAILNAGVILMPLGRDILNVAKDLGANGQLLATFQHLKSKESAFGAANLLFALAAIFMAVTKPKLQRSRAGNA